MGAGYWFGSSGTIDSAEAVGTPGAAVTADFEGGSAPAPSEDDAKQRAEAEALRDRIQAAEANPEAVEIPTPSGDLEEFERILGDAHADVVVENKACDPAVCVFALRVAGDDADEARNALVTAAGRAAFDMEAQPTFRWEEADGGMVGFMWLMPRELTAEQSAALVKRAETQVSSLGG